MRTASAVAVPEVASGEESSAGDRAWLRAVGMRVLLARTACRLSQEEVGRRAGVSRVTVGSMERGDHPASVVAYARLARVLGLPVGDLLAGYGAPSPGESAAMSGGDR